MFAILGANGNVGQVTATTLREKGAAVRAIVRNEAKSSALCEIGCELAVADIRDPRALATAIGDADTVQIILPPEPSSPDPARGLRERIGTLVQALEMAKPARVLAISDYGAHISEDIGMPTVFHGFEASLQRLDTQLQILRTAEYMQNWWGVIPGALETGLLPTFHDRVDEKFATISAPDLGLISASLLLQPVIPTPVSIVHAEGPDRYSASNVADALTILSGRHIQARSVPRDQWQGALEKVVPPSLADLLIKTNEAHNRGGLIDVEPGARDVRHGTTALIDALMSFKQWH